jgi:hypothetical protein
MRLGTFVEACQAGLPPALGTLLDIDRRVAVEDVRCPVARCIVGADRHQSPTAADRLGINVGVRRGLDPRLVAGKFL